MANPHGQPTKVVRQAALEVAQAAAAMKREDFQNAYSQLRAKELLFVQAYLATDNPRMAALAAHPELQSRPQLADVRALDMLKRPLVRAAIAEKLHEVMSRYEVTTDRVVQEIAKVGFANMGDYIQLTSDGEPYIDLSGLSPEQMAAIAEVTVEDFKEGRGEDARDVRRVKFKLHDKLSGLDKLMKRLGAYAPERRELSGPGGTPIPVAQLTVEMTAESAADYYAQMLEAEEREEIE